MPDDNDIRIYVKGDFSEKNDIKRLTDEIQLQKDNGNYDRAVALGCRLAQTSPEDVIPGIGEMKLTSADMYQARVLIMFMAENTVRSSVESSYLCDVTVNSMFDWLKNNENMFYKNLSDGVAFSFYLMAVDKGGDVLEGIGRQFALRCASRHDEYAKIGRKICEDSSAYFGKLINDVAFR